MAQGDLIEGVVRTSEREVIEISITGSVDLVVLARFTAAIIGARAGFDLDEIDDLRLAVDELSVSFGRSTPRRGCATPSSARATR